MWCIGLIKTHQNAFTCQIHYDLFVGRNLSTRKFSAYFEKAGFEIIRAEEVFKPIRFFDIGAFVWFAHIIEWEFTGFSVDKCFDKLLKMQEVIDKDGFVEGTIHRYLIVAKKML